MLGSFNKSFRNHKPFSVPVPKAIIKSLSQGLPEEFKYKQVKKGICAITIPKAAIFDGKITINNSTEENMRKCKSYGDYFFYATNLQEKIFVEPNEDGYLTINGKPFRLNELVIAPYESIKVESGGIYVDVPRLDKRYDLDISIGETKYAVTMKRVIFDSMDHFKFVNESYPVLILALICKPDLSEVSITANVDFSRARCVTDICDGISIYNGFVKGKAKIFGTLVSRKNYLGGYDEDIVGFWKSLEKLEKIFNVKFDVSNYSMDVLDVELVKQLTNSIILDKPYIPRERIAFINGEANEEVRSSLEQDIGKPAVFQYIENVEGTLLGASIKYTRLSLLFDAKMDRIEYSDDGKKYKVYFSSREGKEYYQVNKEFLNESECDKYHNDPTISFDEFASAKKLETFTFVY